MRWALFFMVIASLFFVDLAGDPLEEASTYYRLGESSESFEKRSDYFNKALKLYQQIDSEDAKLHFNKGNCYYQLGHLGMAIWHYQKAKMASPRDAKILGNLKRAYVQANISPEREFLDSLFFFHKMFKFSEKVVFFNLFLIVFFILASSFIWSRRKILKVTSLSILVPLFVLGFSLYIDEKDHHLKAVLIQPTFLRCDAGKQYKEVSEKVELAGQVVKIIEISDDKNWVKVKCQSKKEGYVPLEKIRTL